jgi:hypothetical protein
MIAYPYFGSEREFDRVPNWRGFEDFWFSIEAGVLDDCICRRRNRSAVVEAEDLLG